MSGIPPFLWQSALILLIAYFLGAWFGCMFRRLLTRPPKVEMAGSGAAAALPAAGATQTGAVPRSETAEDRFGRALQDYRRDDAQPQRAEPPPSRPAAPPQQPAAVAPAPPASPPPEPARPTEQRTAPIAPNRDRPPQSPPPQRPEPSPQQPTSNEAAAAGIAGAASAAALAAAAAARRQTPRNEAESPPARPESDTAQSSGGSIAARMQALPDQPAPEPSRPAREPEAPRPAPPASSAPVISSQPASGAVRPRDDDADRRPAEAQPNRAGLGAAAGAAAAAAAAAATSTLSEKQAPKPAPEPKPAPTPAPSAMPVAASPSSPPAATATPPPSNNLRLINAISTADADALNRAGITSFQQIAAWTRRDLDRLPDSLGGRRRIARENWIEQAALLAKGTPTAHIRRLKARADAAAAAQRPAPPEPETLRRTGPPQGPQARPEASAPTPPPTPRPAARPVQAEPAAAPPATAQPQLQPPRPQQVGPQPILATRATGVPSTGPRADRPAASPATPAQRPTPATPARPGDRSEDLTRIDGIDANVAKSLNVHGITRIDQIAHWSDDVQRRVDRLFGDEDRVRREDWVGQARRLAGLETPNAGPQASSGAGAAAAAASAVAGISATARPRPSPPAEEDGAGKSSQASQPPQPSQSAQPATPEPASIPAPPPRPAAPPQASQPSPSAVSPEAPKTAQLAAAPSPPTSSSGGSVERLRSVRSAALVGRDASDMGGSDDLKRIRGIGVLIEKRLKMMGYTRYAEIAEWSQADIDRVNEQLDFGGRIERENWIQQARILSNGGQTEFSRRQDRNSD